MQAVSTVRDLRYTGIEGFSDAVFAFAVTLLLVSLNMLFLFVVLLYVYPMEFLLSLIADQLFWTVSPEAVHSVSEVRQLMVTYGL
jgi:uncharacterized membrane protein